jgi:hypothetical protein
MAVTRYYPFGGPTVVVRVSHPGTPTRLVDLGPAHGQRHRYEAMRKTVDSWRPFDNPSHPIHNVELERPR